MGIGSEEDTMGSVTHLFPKPPKKDFQKLMANDQRVYRFMARFEDPSPQDAERRFVISAYLGDDTIAVFEPPLRNSGIIGGKFLERRRFKKAHSDEYVRLPPPLSLSLCLWSLECVPACLVSRAAFGGVFSFLLHATLSVIVLSFWLVFQVPHLGYVGKASTERRTWRASEVGKIRRGMDLKGGKFIRVRPNCSLMALARAAQAERHLRGRSARAGRPPLPHPRRRRPYRA